MESSRVRHGGEALGGNRTARLALVAAVLILGVLHTPDGTKGASAGERAALPDFVVTGCQVSSPAPREGDRIQLTFQFQNRGAGPGVFMPGMTEWRAEGFKGRANEASGTATGRSIPPGATFTAGATFAPGDLRAGPQQLTVEVDPGRQVPEWDDRNNQGPCAFTVYPDQAGGRTS